MWDKISVHIPGRWSCEMPGHLHNTVRWLVISTAKFILPGHALTSALQTPEKDKILDIKVKMCLKINKYQDVLWSRVNILFWSIQSSLYRQEGCWHPRRDCEVLCMPGHNHCSLLINYRTIKSHRVEQFPRTSSFTLRSVISANLVVSRTTT